MITANLYHGIDLKGYELAVLAPLFAKRLLVLGGVADGAPLRARVNHGRWVVDCECHGAELAWDERLFMCQSCYNAGHKHQYRRVVFPRARLMIETLLMMRVETNRNWYPNETVAMLDAENHEHEGELL